MQPNPQKLLEEIEACKDKLRALNDEHSVARFDRAVTLQRYEQEMAKVYLTLLDPTERNKLGLEKLPAEDMRKAIAHSKISEVVWSSYLSAEATLEGLDKALKVELSILSGIQSELQYLRGEMKSA